MNLRETKNAPEISIILPCRNEEVALDYCLKQIEEIIKKHQLSAGITISDSSSDSSPDITRRHGVRLIRHNKEGYGVACLEGFSYARGKYIFIADADGTYDFNEILGFIAHLKGGYDLVLGDRIGGKIFPGAMPWHHRYLGNPTLSHFLRIFFRAKIHDPQTGMQAIKIESLDRLDLQAGGMEFTSEMLVKVFKNNLKIKEIPICYYPRIGESELRSFRNSVVFERIKITVITKPRALPVIKPVTASNIVMPASLNKNLKFPMVSKTTFDGLGSTNSGILKTEIRAS